MNPAPEFDITVDSLTYGGDAMGRLPDGRAVFVPFALPGERVRVRLVEEKRGYARARLVEVLHPARERIAPRCPCYMSCGGCNYEHMPYSMQLSVKKEILREQLQRIGGLQEPPVEDSLPSPKEWNYRNHIQLHLTPEGKLGFEAAHSHHVVPLEVCYLPEEGINEAWPLLEVDPVPGLERINFREGAGGEILMVLEGSENSLPEFSIQDIPISAVHLSPAGSILLAGRDYLVMEVLGRSFSVSAGSFFQVNTLQAEAMVRFLLERVPVTPNTTLLELYSGVGLFSAFLAPRVQRLVAIESSPDPCRDFEINLDEFDNVELYEAPVADVLPGLDLQQPGIILADPPRSGLGRLVVEQIIRLNPDTIVYISCDPATLARDARDFIRGSYRLQSITPVDMFPQTYHIESISLWTRA
ncbi:MAG: class I SAM-dependent RNA methyltransferase [Omnitrophica WOR_2 bacterium]